MLATGHDSKDIIYLIRNHMGLKWDEGAIESHISSVKKNYKDFVEIMDAIFKSKYEDFIKLGATDQQAMDCLDDWINSELS